MQDEVLFDNEVKAEKVNSKSKRCINAVSIWCEEYRKIYHGYPKPNGKETGLLNLMRKECESLEHWRSMARAYFEDGDKYLSRQCHPVWELYKRRDGYRIGAMPQRKDRVENPEGEE